VQSTLKHDPTLTKVQVKPSVRQPASQCNMHIYNSWSDSSKDMAGSPSWQFHGTVGATYLSDHCHCCYCYSTINSATLTNFRLHRVHGIHLLLLMISSTTTLIVMLVSCTIQPCIPSGSLNRVPASAGVKAGKSPLPGGR